MAGVYARYQYAGNMLAHFFIISRHSSDWRALDPASGPVKPESPLIPQPLMARFHCLKRVVETSCLKTTRNPALKKGP